jgi:hypothetical protein
MISTSTTSTKKPIELKRMVMFLKRENERLKAGGAGPGSGPGRGTSDDNRSEKKVDTDNVINNLMDQIKVHIEEKERLQNALRTLKENSMLADKSPQDKQIWVLKRTNAKLMDEKKGYEDRINQLKQEIVKKSLRIEELSAQLGIPSEGRATLKPNEQNKNWTDKIKSMFD